MAYADIDALRADYLTNCNSVAEIAAATRMLDAATRFVDSYCRRPVGYFDPAAVGAAERRFRGDGENFLRLPVHVFGSISQVTVDGNVIDAANYYESDQNGWLYREDSVWQSDEGFTPYQLWEQGRTFKVTARWGYAATPADIQQAVMLIAVSLWDRQKGTLGDVSPEGFVIERAMPLLAREILDRYKRREFEVS